ncbi:MAG: nuclear transport factor 2 family protein [Rhodospirillaceae bacterium]
MRIDFEKLLNRFAAAVEMGDGAALGALFAPDGEYRDTFYGAFRGPAAIAGMLEDRFWGDATGFFWDMFDPVYDPDTGRGYSRWVFSYTSTMEGSTGRRVAFDGMSLFEFEDCLIRRYREVFSAGMAFVQLAMAPERAEKLLRRMVEAHANDPEWARHLQG